jgi:hypothetical protein
MDAPLDRVLPRYAHREVHTTDVHAGPDAVWSALHAVTADELPLTRLLTTLRGIGSGRAGQPVLDTFSARGFSVVVDEPPRVLAAAAAGQPWRLRGGEMVELADRGACASFARPGFVVMAVSFALQADGDGRTRLVTETRVQPRDTAAARRFRPYWWAVRAGSGLIRRDLLRAVRRRAERGDYAAAAGAKP